MRLTRSKPKRRKRRRSRRYEAAVPGVRPRLRPVVGAWRGRLDAVPSVFLLVALGWLAGQFFITDKFYVHEITVVGNQFVSAEEIFSASELAGLSIFWVDPARVEAAVARLPGIKEARVRCRLPNRVVVEVVERQAQIVWQRDGTRYWVDEAGVVLPARGELEGALLVEDLAPGPLRVGDRLDPRVVESALELHRLLPELAAVQYSDQGLSFHHQGGYPIYLGVGDMPEKVAIMKALVRKLAAEGIQPEFIDLRFKEGPCYKAGGSK